MIDLFVLLFLKSYYLPFFLIGKMDNYVDLLTGKNLCR